MSAPGPRREKIVDLRIVLSASSARERDDAAIEALYRMLDRAAHRWNGELWPVILRRRIADDYPSARAERNEWLYRQYHARRCWTNETEDQVAQHVASCWNAAGHRVNAKTIKSSAGKARDRVLAWINIVEKQNRSSVRPELTEAQTKLVYAELERAIIKIAQELSPSKKVKLTTAI
jgi:hypothetical protein